jgi:ABC-2 type transport system ATP-binding protein
MHGPPVLLLDEPTVGLDPVARREFWEDVGEIQAARELTVVLSTHLMDEADRCDRLLLLREGEVFALASPDDLKREMGYDIITIRAERAEQLAQAILSKFDLDPHWEDDAVRVEIVDGHQWVGRLMEEFGEDIESITLSKPSIVDVMLFRKDCPDETDNST